MENGEEEHTHPFGKAENILNFTDSKEINVNDDLLNRVLNHPDVKNRKVAAFSIIGAYRRGKSFFLDYCLRYLYANYPSINYPDNELNNSKNWIGEEDTPLQGFSWRAGSARDTTGIKIWNDVFLHTDEKTGEKMAIIVLDTQGLFDSETTPVDNSRIFALGSLISSIQVLNLSNIIQEDQIQYLQFATEFAKFATADNRDDCNDKAFQNLLFLIRDWQNSLEFEFGLKGGESFLRNFLQVKSGQKEELKSVRQFIDESFEKLSCALLPHPGKNVAGGSKKKANYDGNWGDMDDEFKEELEILIEELLSPGTLVLKKINGNQLTCGEYKEYIVKYLEIFQSDELPQAKTIFETTVEMQMNILINECIEVYKHSLFMCQNKIQTIDELPFYHEMCQNRALLMFSEAKKMGNRSHAKKFCEILKDKLDKYFIEWSDVSASNIKKIEEEKERVRLALEEKAKAEAEQIETKRKAEEKLEELRKEQERKNLEHQKILEDKKNAEMELKVEQERKLRIESEKRGEEKERMMKEQIERERLSAQKLADIQVEMAKKEAERAELERQKEIAEERLKNERERVARIKAEKEKDEAFRKLCEAQAEAARLKNRYEGKKKGPCSIM